MRFQCQRGLSTTLGRPNFRFAHRENMEQNALVLAQGTFDGTARGEPETIEKIGHDWVVFRHLTK